MSLVTKPLSPASKDSERKALAKTIGGRIRLVREILGRDCGEEPITQRELAEMAGVSISSIKNYETTAAVPDALFLLRLFESTGFSPAWICAGIEPIRLPRSLPQADKAPAPEMVRLLSLREHPSQYRTDSLEYRREAARTAAQILLEYANDS